MPPLLTGRTALITGSTQGLGLAAARRFAAAGCNVVFSGLVEGQGVAQVQRALESEHGVRTIFSSADLRDPAEIDRMLAEAHGAFGQIDILVNNAVVRHTGSVEGLLPQQWDEAIAVNLSAAFHTIRLALPGMKARNWGRIINVSSIYGLRGATGRVGYVTTKTALIGLTRAVALETHAHAITCNAVCPGTTRTPVHEAAVAALGRDEGLGEADAEARVLAGKQPTGRLVDADAAAALMVFLCTEDARDITGAVLPIDGGWSAR
jgi:3-hydroxybutyrate dehydrogenase